MAKNNTESKHLWRIYGPAVLVVVLAFTVAFQFIKPAPPSKIVMASGGTSGAYYAFAQRYAGFFKKQGIELEVRNTAGSIENIQLLESGEVDIAFVQSGIEGETGDELLQSLGSVYYEPLWLFHRAEVSVNKITDLNGLRVATGKPGSGTKALVDSLLTDNRIANDAISVQSISGDVAMQALLADKVDVAFFVTSAQSELIKKMLNSEKLELANLVRARAYARRYNYLNNLLLPQGLVDLGENIPAQDIQLLSATANLVVHPEIHPAVVGLMMQIANKVHSSGGWFENRGQFPSAEFLTFPLNEDAARYYKNGPPFLQRYLPHWAASLIDRLKVMLLPLIVLMLPLVKIMPSIYNWRMHARVYRWYSKLEELDDQHRLGETSEQELLDKLKKLDDEVRGIEVPLSFSSRVYDLLSHIALVRNRLSDQ